MLAFALLALFQSTDRSVPSTDAPCVIRIDALTHAGAPAMGAQVFVDGDHLDAPTPAGLTDETGRATVVAKRGSLHRPSTIVLVGADSVGCARVVAYPPDDAPFELDLELVPLVEVAVSTEPPCAACELEVVSCWLGRGGVYEPARFGLESRARTGSDGRALLRLPQDAGFVVMCRSSGFERRHVGRAVEPTVISFDVDGRAARGEPALTSSRLSIQLLANDPSVVRRRTLTILPVSTPVTGWHDGPPMAEHPPTPRTTTLVTDDTGSVSVADYPDLPIALALSRGPGDPPYGVSAVTVPDEPVDGVRTVQVTLAPGSVFTGRVMAAGGLEPIAGVELALRRQHELERATSDADGRFRYVAQPGDRLLVELLSAPEGWRCTTQNARNARFPHACDPDAPLALELVHERPLEVRVRDREGTAVVDATVSAWPVDAPVSSTSTDASGRALLPHVGRGACTLFVECLGFEKRSVELQPGAPPEVVLERAAPHALEVLALDDSLRPVGGLSLALRDERWILARATTDAEGRAMMQVPTGTSRRHLDVAASGFRSASIGMHRSPQGPFVVAVARTGALTGRVVDLAGRPIVGARAQHLAEPLSVRFTDDEGRFSFRSADLSRPLVTVRAPGFRAGGSLAPGDGGELLVRLLREDEAAPAPAAEFPAEFPPEALSPTHRRALAVSLAARLPENVLSGVDLGVLKQRWLDALSGRSETAASEAAPRGPRNAPPESIPYDPEQLAEWIDHTPERGARLRQLLRRSLVPQSEWSHIRSLAPLVGPYRALARVDQTLALELAFELAEAFESGVTLDPGERSGLALLFVALDPPLGRALFAAERAEAIAALQNGARWSEADHMCARLIDGDWYARELTRAELDPWSILTALRVLTAPRSRLLELGAPEAATIGDRASAQLDKWAPNSLDPGLATAGEAR